MKDNKAGIIWTMVIIIVVLLVVWWWWFYGSEPETEVVVPVAQSESLAPETVAVAE